MKKYFKFKEETYNDLFKLVNKKIITKMKLCDDYSFEIYVNGLEKGIVYDIKDIKIETYERRDGGNGTQLSIKIKDGYQLNISNYFTYEVDYDFDVLDIVGLDGEQINHILFQMLLNGGYIPSNKRDFYEYVYDGYVTTINITSRRWWDEFIAITKFGDRYFGFHDASTTCDLTAEERGFEREDGIYEYLKKEIVSYTFEKK